MAVVTKTLKSSGGDYSLMSTWESTEQTDLVAAGDSHVLECDAFTCTDTVVLDGWTTGALNTITIRAAAGQEHNGIDGNGFILQGSNNFGGILFQRQQYTTVEGITVINTGSRDALRPDTVGGSGTGVLCDSLIVKGGSDASQGHGILNPRAGSVIRNCLILDCGADGINMAAFMAATIQNNTIINPGRNGINCTSSSGAAITLTNNVVYGSGTSDYADAGGRFSGSNNASEDTTASTESLGTVTGIVSTTGVDFVDYAGGDYQPTSSGALAGAGTDLSAQFLDDITGALR